MLPMLPRRSPRIRPLSFAATLLTCAAASADIVSLESTGPIVGGKHGSAVACIGDVNGDGYNDVLVGAPMEKVGTAVNAGRSTIYSGRTGAAIRTHSSPTFIASGNFGQSVVGFPDINGDGVADYAIGAPGEATSHGRLHVFSGATGAQIYAVDGISIFNFTRIALVPDCTGDGLPEFVSGSVGQTTSPLVEVREAKNGALWKSLADPTPQSVNFFGVTVAGVPDVTGDGLGDVIVGAERAEPRTPRGTPNDAGRVYVFNGATGALWSTLVSPDQMDSGHFGRGIAGLSDIDGDGRGDIAAGAPFESAANGFDGRVHIYSGATGAWIRTLLSGDPAPYPFTSGEFGGTIAACGDLDGDGIGDLVVGAPEEVPSTGETGRVYAFSGATGALLASHEAPGSSAKRFGHAVDASRDVNGDGKPDIVVGAPDSTSGAAGAIGRAYLIRIVPGDGCAQDAPPVPVTDGTHPFTTVGGSNDFPPAELCGSDSQIFVADAFFEYVASCTGTLTVSTCGTADFDTTIAIYAGCGYLGGAIPSCDPSALVACNDDSPECGGLTSKVSLPTAAGDCYRIRIGGSTQGSGTFTVSCAAACPADLDGNGSVGASDLAVLLGAWGQGGPADLDGNGTVGASDLAFLLGAWGGC